MLARMAMGAARMLDVHVETSHSSGSLPEQGHSLVVDFNLRTCAPDNTWDYLSGVCGRTIAPVYKNIHTMLYNDFEHVAQILSDLEGDNETDKTISSHRSTILVETHSSFTEQCRQDAVSTNSVESCTIGERSHRKRRRSSVSGDEPIIIPSSHPSVPLIIITPCQPQACEQSCRVPYQNSDFGKLLIVPSHMAYNNVYPPMSLNRGTIPMLQKWKWKEGHWVALVPTLEEQADMGLFSRIQPTRKRTCRSASTIARAIT